MYGVLLDRCQSLEASHARLTAEFHELQEETNKKTKKKKEEEDDEVVMTSECEVPHRVRGFFLSGSPYRSILDNMGHAVHLCSASAGEIQYWYVIGETASFRFYCAFALCLVLISVHVNETVD
jgi:hypothetical protein